MVFKRISLLKQQADREHAEFEKEWKELGRLIENDKKMKEFVRQANLNEAVDKVKNKKTTVNIADQTQAKEEPKHEGVDAAVLKKFEEQFAELQKATGHTEIEDLVTSFTNGQQNIFSLLQYGSEQTGFIAAAQAEAEAVQKEIAVRRMFYFFGNWFLKIFDPAQSTFQKRTRKF